MYITASAYRFALPRQRGSPIQFIFDPKEGPGDLERLPKHFLTKSKFIDFSHVLFLLLGFLVRCVRTMWDDENMFPGVFVAAETNGRAAEAWFSVWTLVFSILTSTKEGFMRIQLLWGVVAAEHPHFQKIHVILHRKTRCRKKVKCTKRRRAPPKTTPPTIFTNFQKYLKIWGLEKE